MERRVEGVGFGACARWLTAVVFLTGGAACGPTEEVSSPPSLGVQEQELETDNGMSLNGLSLNGLSTNGLSTNGLSTNGLATAEFSAWFGNNEALNQMVMKYMVRCAVAAGQSRNYQNSSTATSHSWQGGLGLAPGWASGQPLTETEQQLVSACLAAHTNKFGMNVGLSILGPNGQQGHISYSSTELQTFPRREACFFGNIFTGEGVFAAVDRDYLNDDQSTTRACGLTTRDGSSASGCSPLVHVASCETYCTLDASGLFYSQCVYNGRTYLPLTTRIRPQDVFKCGDGVCQPTEKCGTGTRANSCMADCGVCP
jgi:hypothetical protein